MGRRHYNDVSWRSARPAECGFRGRFTKVGSTHVRFEGQSGQATRGFATRCRSLAINRDSLADTSFPGRCSAWPAKMSTSKPCFHFRKHSDVWRQYFCIEVPGDKCVVQTLRASKRLSAITTSGVASPRASSFPPQTTPPQATSPLQPSRTEFTAHALVQNVSSAGERYTALALPQYRKMHHSARKPSRQPIFLPCAYVRPE